MQINNYTTKYNNSTLSFEALKSIKFKDGYRNKPELQLKLLETLDTSRTLKKIYHTYDVNLIFNAYKIPKNYITELEFWFDKPRYDFWGKLHQLFHRGYYMEINTSDTTSSNIYESTDLLIKKISGSKERFSNSKKILDKIFSKEDDKENLRTKNNLSIMVKKKLNSMIYK